MLPAIRCPRRAFAEVAADPLADCWRDLPSESFRDTVTGEAPQQATSVKTAWSDFELRVLFEVTDSHIVATQTKRDGPLWEEEVVEVFIDPVGDLEAYFEFEVNPLNTVLDLVSRKNRSGYAKNFCWQCEDLRTAVSSREGGWCAELAFPFASLATDPPKRGSQWRINFCRIDRPPGLERELTAWSPTGRANFHTPERFGILQFSA